jgi:hypothetical protein
MAESPDAIDELPIVDGSIHGGASFAVGYLVTLVLVVVAESEQLTNDLFEGAGRVYYDAHFADVELRAPRGFETVDVETTSINYLTGQGPEGMEIAATELPPVVYHAIPVVVLLVFGFLLANKVGAGSPADGAKAGASLVFGVAILALGGTYLFELGEVIGPNRPQGVLLVGILFPLVFGALGGVLASRVDVRIFPWDE